MSRPVAPRTQFHRLTVGRVDPLTDDSAAVTFDVPVRLLDTFTFTPGQSLTIRRGDERRSYSICSARGRPPRIGVREVAGGAVSGWLVHQVRAGDVIDVQAPSGSFTPDLDVAGHHVLIAAGSGITPILSIAGSVLAAHRRLGRHAAVRQPAQRHGDVRRRDRRPQGLLPGADLPGPRAQP